MRSASATASLYLGRSPFLVSFASQRSGRSAKAVTPWAHACSPRAPPKKRTKTADVAARGAWRRFVKRRLRGGAWFRQQQEEARQQGGRREVRGKQERREGAGCSPSRGACRPGQQGQQTCTLRCRHQGIRCSDDRRPVREADNLSPHERAWVRVRVRVRVRVSRQS